MAPVAELPIYSPTETEDYLVCPRFRVLKRQWVPRGAPWTPHMLLGTAVHAGLASHYDVRELHDPFQAALATLAIGYVEGSEWTLEGLQKLVNKGLTTALTTELVSPQGSVIAVEQRFAHCITDLVTREPFGLVVTDHKVKLELEKKNLDYRIRDFDPSWQLLHEAWAVWQLFGEVPAWSRAHIVAIGPRPFTHIHSIPITEEKLKDWEESAKDHWYAMNLDSDDPTTLPPMNTRSCWRYGRKCEFYDGCHTFAGDLTKFPTLYDRLPEVVHEDHE